MSWVWDGQVIEKIANRMQVPMGKQGKNQKVAAWLRDESTVTFMREWLSEQGESITAGAFCKSV